ncbi:MAG: UvrD-helicase domain-containing protein [Calditrichaeota bacterium]|jgi:DNA helicase II / ATP-dependent DNA helicase PcrA|nr:UvrD-helicase domain-containing protein [Calditrichota bacterium]
MNNNKLIVAAAGAGKTTYLVNDALAKDGRILILTYTISNEDVIKRRFYQANGCIPRNTHIQTWYSFLIQHGAKPYQGCIDDSLFETEIKGMVLVNNQSGFRYRDRRGPVYWGEDNLEKYYFTKDYKLYSDKISKFVVRCNEKSSHAVIDRLAAVYDRIYIDEVQDLAGYDLELLKELLASPMSILLVGDPRQVTYLTHIERKYAKYQNGKIQDFFETELGKRISCEIDTSTLNVSYRCNQPICEYASKLYPNLPETKSSSTSENHGNYHQGIFLVETESIADYQKRFSAVQLRWDRRTVILSNYPVMNFGEAKGEAFDRVLIYPTEDMRTWVNNNNSSLSEGARAKFYVALTRARYSAAIAMDFNDVHEIQGVNKWKFSG